MVKKINLKNINIDDLVDELGARGYDWLEKIYDYELIDEIHARSLDDTFDEGLGNYSDQEIRDELSCRGSGDVDDADRLREIKQAVLKGDFNFALLRLDQLLPATHRYLDG